MNYHAEVLDVSLVQKKMLKEYTAVSVRKRFLGLLKIYTISIPENQIEETVKRFQNNLGNALHKEWYITFHTDHQAIVLFREKSFRLNTEGIQPVHYQLLNTEGAADKQNWDNMIAYARSLGVPDDQCDFLPDDYKTQQYDS
ncbi:MAG: hypothetical protein PHU79_00155 [Oscillospiraceae bacterium]|nr:hypothetical protein [Oscillospiraceae bacterium]